MDEPANPPPVTKGSDPMKSTARKNPGGRAAGFTMSAKTRKKLAKAMRARWKKARTAGTAPNASPNGVAHAVKQGTIDLDLDLRRAKTKTVRSEILDLAHTGARLRIIELERELQKLRIFLGNK